MSRSLDLRNQYTQLIGGLRAPDVPEENMIKAGERLNAMIAEAREEFAVRGKDDVRVFSDLVNLDFLGDPDTYPSELNNIIGTLAGLEPTCKALKALGVKYDPANIASLQLTAKTVARSPILALVKLWNSYIDYVSGDKFVDDIVDGVIFDSTRDLASSVLTPTLFAKENNITDVPDGTLEEKEEYIKTTYFEQYREWTDLRCNDILGTLLENPRTSAIIYPIGYNEACEEIKRTLLMLEFIQDKEEIDRLISTTSPNSLYGGSFYEKMLEMIKSNITDAVKGSPEQMAIVNEVIRAVAVAIDKYIDKNKIPDEVTIGGQKFRPLQAITFTDILIHSLIKASFEIRVNEHDLSPETEYMVSLIREELEKKLDVPMEDETAYRVTSLISLYLDIGISKSIFLKVMDSTFAHANQMLGELCLQHI